MHPSKTSKSHPLRIDSVAVDGSGGRIGLTFCPGKKQNDAQSGVWDRGLDDDMEAIKTFGAAALVTLMPDSELQSLHVPPDQIRDRASELGIEWYQLPIADAGVPDQSFEDSWGGHWIASPVSIERRAQYCDSLQGRSWSNGHHSCSAFDRVRNDSPSCHSIGSQSTTRRDREQIARTIRSWQDCGSINSRSR